ncbi:hypothetical protein E4198_19985 [Streptomyces sp. RKND-216]|uniref:DUF5336 domain-containing protein n=1 Tax=Streptomyces sp. RKND-216 TaxID=2562581 RepID=UPI00109DB607|nr:DUF5336 domain-containing protein [Streptomyces sp. RKND-216]THA26645.1 hypothetical protein E4198_19985 [Streptomyces sp. RKND-216]
MNIRSLTRGDGAVIGAALLLFIASFLDFYAADCEGEFCDGVEMPNAWDTERLGLVLPTLFLVGILAAALIVVGRFVPQVKFGGLTLSQWGVPLAVASLWSSLWSLIVGPEQVTMGVGAILALLATLVLAAAAVLTEQVPALKASLIPAAGPRPAGPYGQQPPGGYGYPGQQAPYGQQPQPGGYGYPGQQGQPQPGAPQQHGVPQPGQPGQPLPAPGQGQSLGGQPQPQAAQQTAQPQPAGPAPAADFQPFWFAVPVNRPLFPEDGSPNPVAELAPGTWYLAVEQRGQALVAQTQDGRRGVLQDTSGIQRG